MPAVTMLPVLARELLVASRKKQTYQVRLALAFVATAITAITTWVVEWFDISPIRGPGSVGALRFSRRTPPGTGCARRRILTSYLAIAALSAARPPI